MRILLISDWENCIKDMVTNITHQDDFVEIYSDLDSGLAEAKHTAYDRVAVDIDLYLKSPPKLCQEAHSFIDVWYWYITEK